MLLLTCNKEKTSCPDENAYCSLVETQNFDTTGPLIDKFLSKLERNENAVILDQLREWLECKCCVKNVVVICNSCVKTNPAQSELSIDFINCYAPKVALK